MLSPALWELPPLQLHQTFPGTALAPDPSEDRFSIRRQWKPLCLVPTCSEWPLHTRSSLRHPAPAFFFPPDLLGPSCQF